MSKYCFEWNSRFAFFFSVCVFWLYLFFSCDFACSFLHMFWINSLYQNACVLILGIYSYTRKCLVPLNSGRITAEMLLKLNILVLTLNLQFIYIKKIHRKKILKESSFRVQLFHAIEINGVFSSTESNVIFWLQFFHLSFFYSPSLSLSLLSPYLFHFFQLKKLS